LNIYLFFYIIAISVDAFFVDAVAVFICPCHTNSSSCRWGSVKLYLSLRRHCWSAFRSNVLSI